MRTLRCSVLGPLTRGAAPQAFLGLVYPPDGEPRPAVLVNLPDAVVGQPALLQRVIAETHFATTIDHPNVSHVYGLVRLRGGLARVVEYASGETLRLVCTTAERTGVRIPPQVAIALVADACLGAHHVHHVGMNATGSALVHGGIRPETLMVSFSGSVKVSGYGTFALADELARANSATTAGRDVYTALEQSIGGRGASTVRTDVYALGAVLCEALMGKPPARADSEDEDARVQQILASQPQTLGLTRKLATVAMVAMRRKATDRYASALEMRDELLSTGAAASAVVVEGFMDSLFPPDSPVRAARQAILDAAGKAPPPVEEVEVLEPEMVLHHLTPALSVPAAPAVVAPMGQLSVAAPPAPEPVPAEPAPAVDPPPPEETTAPRARRRTKEITREITRETARSNGRLLREEEAPLPPPPPPARSGGAAMFLAGLACGAGVMLGGIMYVNPHALSRPPPAPPPADDSLNPAPRRAPPAPPEPAAPSPAPAPAAPAPAPARAERPAPAPAAPKATQLVVSSLPDAEILVDGKSVGQGSAVVDVKPGDHVVRARDKSQGVDLERKVKVAAGTQKKVSLEVRLGDLVVDAPPGCEVSVDGRKLGTTPLKGIPLSEGKHAIVVTKDGVVYKQVVPIKPDVESTLRVEFRTR